jgi:hypothetical protein
MSGTVTAYDYTTGVLSVSVSQSAGSGTHAAWTVSISTASASPYSVGDIALTNRTLTAPAWLPANGGIYSQSSYAALYAEIGLLRDGVTKPFVAGGWLAQNAGTTVNNAEGFAPFPLTVFDGKFMVYNKTTGAGNSRLAISTDAGVSYTQATMPTTATDQPYIAIVSHNGGTTLVASHASTDAWVARSTNSGATWTPAGIAGYAGGGQLFTLNGAYVLILYAAATAWTSSDGASWTSRTPPTTLALRAVLTYQGQQVAVAVTGAAPWTTLYTSTDAITWTSRSVSSMANVFLGGTLASLNDVFVWVPTSTDTTYRRSTDGGATWAAITLPHVINVPAYPASTVRLQVFKGRFVYLSFINGENVLVSSADGLTWRIDTTPISGDDVSNIGYLRATESELWLVDTAPSTAGTAYCLTDWAGSWLPTVSAETTANSDDMLITLAETGGVQVYLPGGTLQTRRRSVYTYNSATQFAVPAVPAPTGVTAYIKA